MIKILQAHPVSFVLMVGFLSYLLFQLWTGYIGKKVDGGGVVDDGFGIDRKDRPIAFWLFWFFELGCTVGILAISVHFH
ncbi:MAG: hypothetical protein LV481_05480 [Methylacidiphilales bacterium]|nr:hypothetical protein [Candidatus Methylacidiphilales bacterium]